MTSNQSQETEGDVMNRKLLSLALVSAFAVGALANEGSKKLPAPDFDPVTTTHHDEKIIFAGGCFWGVQSVFQHVKGVKNAVSGYAGGDKDKAHYDLVGNGNTGHAESVEITYDPAVISTGQLLRVFFSVAHDPTQLNRQGPDTGTQYRSEIFTTNEDQNRTAREYISQLNKSKQFEKPIVTLIEKNVKFYPAEAYHQDYAFLHPDEPYIVFNDLPKVKNLEKLYPDIYLSDPTLSSKRNKS